MALLLIALGSGSQERAPGLPSIRMPQLLLRPGSRLTCPPHLGTGGQWTSSQSPPLEAVLTGLTGPQWIHLTGLRLA